MSQAIVLDYNSGCVDVYTLPDEVGPEEWLEEHEYINSNCLWMSSDGIIPITIHA